MFSYLTTPSHIVSAVFTIHETIWSLRISPVIPTSDSVFLASASFAAISYLQ